MGFFKEFKEDLTQAVNELLPEEEVIQEDTKAEEMIDNLDAEQVIMEDASDEEEMKDWLEEFTKEAEKQTEDFAYFTDGEEFHEKTERAEEKDMDDNVDMELLALMNEEEVDEEKKTLEMTEEVFHARTRTSVENDDSVTVITKGTTIRGSITSDGSLDIMGTITGDIECLGKLSISGKIVGNSMASEVYVNAERLVGSINSEGSVKVGLGSVIIGDIIATSGVIAGAVKGEIDINGPVIIDSTAIIKGNIKAKSIQINNGAVMEGFCSLSYASVDLDNIFE